ncbi:MAG: ROK family protein [Alicyclobacillaceae bacterium]|nr:ROK family protein [Alicyclobacillaceae bacterium]
MGDDGVDIGVDLGGTKLAAALVGADGRVSERVSRSTPQTGRDDVLDALTETVRHVRQRASKHGLVVQSVGIGTAGQIDVVRGVVLAGTANIHDWNNVPLRDAVAAATGLTTFVDNDVPVVLQAEREFGAAQGCTDVVCLTVGTGIGGAVLTGGRLLRGAWGGAAELGHISVDKHGPVCACGFRGCLEMFASGTAVARRMAELTHGDRTWTGVEVFQAALCGDALAEQVVSEALDALAYGVVSLIHTFNPKIMLLGGGVFSEAEWLRERLENKVHGMGIQSMVQSVHIRRVSLGTDAGLIGAARLRAMSTMNGELS